MKLFLGLAFLIACFGTADAAPKVHADWYECKSGSECTVVKGNCGVEWAANRKHAEESRKHPPRKDSPCRIPLESHPANGQAVCLDGKCTLVPTGSSAGGKTIGGEDCVLAECWGHLGCNYVTCTRSDGSKVTKFAQ